MHLPLGLVSRYQAVRAEDGDEKIAEDPETKISVPADALRRRSVRLAIWHRRLLTVWLRLPSRGYCCPDGG